MVLTVCKRHRILLVRSWKTEQAVQEFQVQSAQNWRRLRGNSVRWMLVLRRSPKRSKNCSEKKSGCKLSLKRWSRIALKSKRLPGLRSPALVSRNAATGSFRKKEIGRAHV